MNPDYFEAIMLICFGVAWPFSIFRMLKTKRSFGKSEPFIGIVLIGYISGILFQWFGDRDIVIYLYVLNTLLVSVDFFLTIKYRKATNRDTLELSS